MSEELLRDGFRRAVLKFLVKNGALSEALRRRVLAWRHCGFSAHNAVRVPAEDAEGRKQLAGTILRAQMSLEKMASSFGAAGSVIALLLWVYYSAQIFFLGAEFTRQYALWFGSLQHERQHVKQSHRLATLSGEE